MAILPKRGRGGEASTLETNKQKQNKQTNKTHRRFITFSQKHVWCDTVVYFRNNRISGGVWMLRDALRASCFFVFLFFLRGGITRSNNIKRFKVQTKVEIYEEVFSPFPLFLYIYRVRVRVRVRVYILFFFCC